MRIANAGSVGAAAAMLLALAAAAAIWIVGPDLADAWAWLVTETRAAQRELHRDLSAATRAVKTHGITASIGLIALSFLYGVFHAVGPGHGKAVISTYLATHESQLSRGLLLSGLSSLMQAVTAIFIVETTFALLNLGTRDAQGTADNLELLSFVMVGLVGAVLAFMSGRRLLRRLWPSHGGGHGVDCGHRLGPDSADPGRPLAPRQLAAIVLSVGIRPCSGGILVLLLAHTLDLRWAGIGAVLAMSVGTAFTVSALAVLSVLARRTALRLSSVMAGANWAPIVLDSVGLLGGFAILLLGVSLFEMGLTTGRHPLLR